MTQSSDLDGTQSTATCAHCASPLTIRTHETIQVFACDAQHGIFLHSDALRVAVNDRTADRSEHEEQSAEAAQGPVSIEQVQSVEHPRSCPTCGGAMEKRIYAYESGVTMDVCPLHGIWLDQGELEQIEAWFEAQERHLERDRATWGGTTGKLEQIEEQAERQRAEDVESIHWGPVGWFAGRMSWWHDRRDD